MIKLYVFIIWLLFFVNTGTFTIPKKRRHSEKVVASCQKCGFVAESVGDLDGHICEHPGPSVCTGIVYLLGPYFNDPYFINFWKIRQIILENSIIIRTAKEGSIMYVPILYNFTKHTTSFECCLYFSLVF